MTPYLNGGGFSFSITSVGGKWSWSVVASNVPGALQTYSITDIRTPYGPIGAVNSPIPGDVLDAMCSSLNSFRTQLNPALSIVSGSAISATVSEGDPMVDIGDTLFSNNGALGSSMSVSAVSEVSWLTPRPTSFVSLGKGDTGTLKGRLNPGLLSSSMSPYVGNIILQDNATPPNLSSVEYEITVLPRPSMSLNFSSVSFVYNLNSNAVTAPIEVGLTNTGPITSKLNYYLTKARNSSWLTYFPTSGGPLDSYMTDIISFRISTSAVPKVAASYTETVVFNSYNSTNNPVLLTVNLTVVE